MPRSRQSSLALASVGLAAAAIIGVQMGESAIAEIDPAYFRGPLERPQGITPQPEAAPFNPYAQPYVWSMPPTRSLVDCDAACEGERRRAVNLALAEPAGRDAALPYWRDATPATELQPWAPGRTAGGGRDLERYMHYPVTREQAEQTRVEAPAETATTASARPASATMPEPAAALSVAPVAEQ